FFCDPGDEKYFEKEIRVRLYSVPGPAQRVSLPEANEPSVEGRGPRVEGRAPAAAAPTPDTRPLLFPERLLRFVKLQPGADLLGQLFVAQRPDQAQGLFFSPDRVGEAARLGISGRQGVQRARVGSAGFLDGPF